ncbi:hypothetical protein BHE74_00048769, partial [Ensete ventricosum]
MEETPTSDRVDLPPSSSLVPPSNPQIFLSPMIESYENGDGAPEIGSDGEWKVRWGDREKPVAPVLVSKVLTYCGV